MPSDTAPAKSSRLGAAGVLQFSLGAGVAPIVGMAGGMTALPMALSITVLELCVLMLGRGLGLSALVRLRSRTVASREAVTP